MQVLFHWTRSKLLGARLFSGEEVILDVPAPKGDSFLFTLTLPKDHVRSKRSNPVGALRNARLEVRYAGEPLQPRNVVWLSADAQPIDEEAEFAAWIACRQAAAALDPARACFLAIDMESHQQIVKRRTDWTAAFIQARIETIEVAMAQLGPRIYLRRSGGDPGPLSQKSQDALQEIAGFMRPAFDALGGRAQVDDACNRFAAGLLGHTCSTTIPELWPIISCDADSAFILYFAECALAMDKVQALPQSEKQYWSSMVNAFARMQEIYFQRYTTYPRKLANYLPPTPALAQVPGDIVNDYAAIGDDIPQLKARISKTLCKYLKH